MVTKTLLNCIVYKFETHRQLGYQSDGGIEASVGCCFCLLSNHQVSFRDLMQLLPSIARRLM